MFYKKKQQQKHGVCSLQKQIWNKCYEYMKKVYLAKELVTLMPRK